MQTNANTKDVGLIMGFWANCQEKDCGTRFWVDSISDIKCPKCGDKKKKNAAAAIAAVRREHIRRGPREDLGHISFDSRMEANYCRYLEWLRKSGEILFYAYHPNEFDFTSKYKHGTTRYTPDFLVIDKSGHLYYVETKGYLDNKDKVKHKRMRELFPDVDLRIVPYKEFKSIERDVAPLIKGWEVAA